MHAHIIVLSVPDGTEVAQASQGAAAAEEVWLHCYIDSLKPSGRRGGMCYIERTLIESIERGGGDITFPIGKGR